MKLFTGAPFILTLAALAILIVPSSAHAQADCKILYDAVDKLTTVPYHAYSTQKTDGKDRTAETILIGDVIYVNADGKWIKSPITPKEMREQEKENRKDATQVSCKHERDESVSGEPAEVYSTHNKNGDVDYNARIWLSTRTGLILREELDMDTGGPGGKSHSSIRYDYSNVSAPAVVSSLK
jgi:outer membrane lipoprotein-sorting protein